MLLPDVRPVGLQQPIHVTLRISALAAASGFHL
jgi:hypothetical protein